MCYLSKSSKHIQRGPVDPITHLQGSLVWGPDTLKGAGGSELSSTPLAMDQVLQAALKREREREVGVIICRNRPDRTDKPIASAGFVNEGEFDGRAERQAFSKTEMRTEMDG